MDTKPPSATDCLNLAYEIWGDWEMIFFWMLMKNRGIGYRPSDLMVDQEGLDLLHNYLSKIQAGVYV